MEEMTFETPRTVLYLGDMREDPGVGKAVWLADMLLGAAASSDAESSEGWEKEEQEDVGGAPIANREGGSLATDEEDEEHTCRNVSQNFLQKLFVSTFEALSKG